MKFIFMTHQIILLYHFKNKYPCISKNFVYLYEFPSEAMNVFVLLWMYDFFFPVNNLSTQYLAPIK